MTLFGDRIVTEISMWRRGHCGGGGPQIHYDWYPYEMGKFGHREKMMCRHTETTPCEHGGHRKLDEARSNPLWTLRSEWGPASTLISDFWPSGLWDNRFLFFFGHPVLSLLFQHPYKTNRPSMSALKLFLKFHVGSKMTDFRRKWGAQVTHLSCLVSLLTHVVLFAYTLGLPPSLPLSLSHSLSFNLKPRQGGVQSSYAQPSNAQLSWDLHSQDYGTHPQWMWNPCYLGLCSKAQHLLSPILPLSYWEVLTVWEFTQCSHLVMLWWGDSSMGTKLKHILWCIFTTGHTSSPSTRDWGFVSIWNKPWLGNLPYVNSFNIYWILVMI